VYFVNWRPNENRQDTPTKQGWRLSSDEILAGPGSEMMDEEEWSYWSVADRGGEDGQYVFSLGKHGTNSDKLDKRGRRGFCLVLLTIEGRWRKFSGWMGLESLSLDAPLGAMDSGATNVRRFKRNAG
jgi:hypothetical protein